MEINSLRLLIIADDPLARAGLATLLLTRSDVDATLMRAPGGMYQTLSDGRLSNLYLS